MVLELLIVLAKERCVVAFLLRFRPNKVKG
jgi:hypothetical protein